MSNNQYIYGNQIISGSLTAPSITGSLFGTASHAITASYWSGSVTTSLTASYVNPLTQNVQITGSLIISASGTTNDLLIGTNKLFVSSSGNIGIGTTNPTIKLDVQESTGTGNQIVGRFLAGTNTNGSAGGITLGSTQTQAGYIYGVQTATSTGDLVFGNQYLGSYAERMRILGNGNVGIDTTNPLAKFVVSNAGTQSVEIGYSVGLTSNYLESFNRSSSLGVDMSYYIANTGAHRFFTDGSERIRIQPAGNVGIGTTSPTEKLTVAGNIFANAGNNEGFKLNGGLSIYRLAGDDLGFFTANSERMRITSAGDIGIGTTSPNAKLDVNGNVIITGSLNQGGYSTVYGSGAHAQGVNTEAYSTAHSEGQNTIASGYCSHAEGAYTNASSNYSHAEGQNTTAEGTYSHAEGYYTRTTSAGGNAHTEGYLTTASAAYAHAEGQNTIASGQSAHAEGYATTASGQYAHSEGAGFIISGEGTFYYPVLASGYASHAEGYGTRARATGSHSEGYQTIADGYASHAEGGGSWASASYSHAEGQSTTAAGQYSHAEGYQTVTYGYYSHAEGFNTIASGSSTHAEGYLTKAYGDYSHAAGRDTVTNGAYQSAIGILNISSSAEGAFIIGNGDYNYGTRSNLVFASGSTFQITGSLNLASGYNASIGNVTVNSNLLYRGLILQGGYSTTVQRQQNLMTFGALGSSYISSNPFNDTGSGFDRNWHIGSISNTDYFQSPRFSFINSGSERLTILQNNGNVGISITSPLTKLHAVDINNFFAGSFSGGSSGNLVALGTVSNVPSINGYTSGYGSTTNLSLQSQGGNVGIGKTSTNAKLDVNGDTIITGSLNFDITGTTRHAKIFTGTTPNPNPTSLTSTLISNFGVNGHGLILQSGATNDNDIGGIKITDDGVAIWGSGDNDLFRAVNEDGNYLAFVITNNGSVGIGMDTGSTAYQLHLSSDSAAKPSTNTWTISSDSRIKENIIEADYDICYDIVKNLPLKRYTWKPEAYTDEQVPDRSKLGWIAQDVETLFPKAVTTHSFSGVGDFHIDDCKSLNSDQIYAAMYGTIKKLIIENDTLKSELQAIKTHIGL